MKPGVQRLAWLVGACCLGALAIAVGQWRRESDAMPQQAMDPLPSPAVALAPAAARELASAPTSTSVPASAIAMAASAFPAQALTDVSRMQRDIQLAISTDQRGKAGEAAAHIQRCLALERNPEQARQWTEDVLRRMPGWTADLMRGSHQALVASCQAVDAASRAQLVPLLRRSMAEGDKGAAAGLVQALGKDFNAADTPGVIPALRRDAWDCDRNSQGVLASLGRRDPQLLTPDEIGVLRDQQRRQVGVSLEAALRKAAGDPKRQAALEQLLASFQPPPEADAAEVARISAGIQSRCDAARAALLAGSPH